MNDTDKAKWDLSKEKSTLFKEDEIIKEIFSTEILSNISDKAISNTLREVLFKNNNIDWQKAYDVAIKHMPELEIILNN